MHPSLLHAARGAALSGPGVGRKAAYKMGAVLAYGKHPISTGYNSYKTHPYVARHCEYPYLHAEMAAILAAGLDNCQGSVLACVRLRKDGTYGMARPCANCLNMIRAVKIKKVFYTTNQQTVEVLRL